MIILPRHWKTSAMRSREFVKGSLAITARLICRGKGINPPARELVPCDIIKLRRDDIVPHHRRG